MNASTPLPSLEALDPARFETPAILKKAVAANRQLAELKGVASSMPNEGILISTLGLQEAKDSSAIENIVTTHDELFREAAFPKPPPVPQPRRLPVTARRSRSVSVPCVALSC